MLLAPYQADDVGCTAEDPSNPMDECDTLGEPCVNGLPGEFCCLDECPRLYCTAKPAPAEFTTSSVNEEVVFLSISSGDVKEGLEGTVPNNP